MASAAGLATAVSRSGGSAPGLSGGSRLGDGAVAEQLAEEELWVGDLEAAGWAVHSGGSWVRNGLGPARGVIRLPCEKSGAVRAEGCGLTARKVAPCGRKAAV
jgi:hypothetical protein